MFVEIKLKLETEGKTIPDFGILIATVTKINGGMLITRDKHFENIEGLKVTRVNEVTFLNKTSERRK